MPNTRFNKFIEHFNNNLIGYNEFKKELKSKLESFRFFKKIEEHKNFSIFLFGISGIGKTEVARIISQFLYTNSKYLAKINFGNYSSQDALNSLIGSPRGYIGSDHSELSEKINKSKSGILLCDEFEKATRKVFNFFLELLEDGKFTDSMAREYDLNGYIVVFTSNIKSEQEYKKSVPIELQTRFDLVCNFEELSNNDKTQFVKLLFDKISKKINKAFPNIELSDDDINKLFDFDYFNTLSLRDIKRDFYNRLQEIVSDKLDIK